MKKKVTFEQQRRRTNVVIGFIAFIIGMLPAAALVIQLYGMFAAAKPENRFPEHEDDADWTSATFTDETFGGFEEDLDEDFTYEEPEEDFWFGTEDVDVDDAYDYGTDSEASFDESFVDGNDYVPQDSEELNNSLRAAWENWADGFELISVWCFESDESLQDITDTELQAFESSGLYLEDPEAFENAVASALQTDAVGFTVMKGTEKYVVTVWCYDSAESWYTTDGTFELEFTQDFNEAVGDMINDDNVQVLLSMAPLQVTDDMPTTRMFNRFDDKVTANYTTRVTDWEEFKVQFETWEDKINAERYGFICFNDLSNNKRNYVAVACNDRGECIGKTVYTTELVA